MKSDGPQFHQYQQNEQSRPFLFTFVYQASSVSVQVLLVMGSVYDFPIGCWNY
jgi:hypothetical protein